MPEISVELFSTCPPSNGFEQAVYVRKVGDVAHWSEQVGCKGILVYTDNSLVDPWLLSQIIIQNTDRLCPLVAVQPVYMHPYTVAKMVASIGHLHGRRVYLNMVAGGFKNDLSALNDPTPHDKRYDRLIEYTTVIRELLSGPLSVRYEGEFYSVNPLKLTPSLPPHLFPGIFVSGSSEAGLKASKTLKATAIKYPKPEGERPPDDASIQWGIRVGIIAREDPDEAWAVARARFPEERKGQLMHQLAMKVSDSSWHRQLSRTEAESPDGLYWMTPFQNYKSMCPYLVGSSRQVGAEVARYIAMGCRSFILDVPPDEEELEHTRIVFNGAVEEAQKNGHTTSRVGHDPSRAEA
jgi:alkanesulfonate monooxygenase